MRFLGLFLTSIIAILPMLWIEDYTVTNPIWWTVLIVWLLGRFVGLIESEEN